MVLEIDRQFPHPFCTEKRASIKYVNTFKEVVTGQVFEVEKKGN